MTRTESLDLDSALGPQQEVGLPGGTVRYRERGAGPTLLFVHGLLVNGALWRKVVPELAPDFRCIAPDWPLGSHEVPLGDAADRTPAGMAALIADFMAALELDDVTLVANDSGGALSQIVVTRHPERVGRLVLTPCDAFDNFPPKMFRYLGWAAKVPGGMAPIVQSMRLRANRRTPIAFGWLTKRRLPNAVSDHYVNPVIHDRRIREDARAFILGVDSAYTMAAAEKLPGFDRPVLLAWAPEDCFFPIEHAERLAELLPDARLARIEDSRTFVSEDQPQRLAELIAGFVREPAKAAAG
ncbi:MAG TPA: alpha/beta hydrolase [Solirubrobacteraceae bacterium]|nr:alpha/beta hydrolase [Solirubrobacteraceae bacterium]